VQEVWQTVQHTCSILCPLLPVQGLEMFGSSEKNDTAKKVQAMQSKAEVFYSVIANAKPDDLVFIGNKALRKSFITSIEPIRNPDTKLEGSRIYYFSFDLNDYRDRLCSYMDFWEPEVSFEDIKKILQD